MTLQIQPFNVLSGSESLTSTHEGWSLDARSETGEQREYRASVAFDRAFNSTPVVHVGIVGLDTANDDAARVRISAANITSHGFEIVVSTWLHSRLWRVDVSWLAIGA